MSENPSLESLVGQVVFVCWLDSASQASGWASGVPEAADMRCYSAGKLVAANENSVTVAGHWTEDEQPQRAGSMTIPTTALLSWRAVE